MIHIKKQSKGFKKKGFQKKHGASWSNLLGYYYRRPRSSNSVSHVNEGGERYISILPSIFISTQTRPIVTNHSLRHSKS